MEKMEHYTLPTSRVTYKYKNNYYLALCFLHSSAFSRLVNCAEKSLKRFHHFQIFQDLHLDYNSELFVIFIVGQIR